MNRILICQTAHMGDIIATLPVAYLIKKKWPNCQVTYLCGRYACDVCDLATDIDDVIIWEDLQAVPEKDAVKLIKELKFDAVLHVNTKQDISKLMFKAKIKKRIDMGHKLYKLLYSNCLQKTVKYYRKRQFHQALINLQCLRGLDIPVDYTREEIIPMLRLKSQNLTHNITKHLDKQRFNLVLHPFSNKSGREWPLTHFETLVEKLDKKKFNIIISGSAKEGEQLKGTTLSDPHQVTNVCGKTTITELFNLLAHVDGVVVSGTGPLHIAAALGTRCLGLFPTAKGEFARPDFNRWRALGARATSIASSQVCADKCEVENCACMQALSVNYVQSFITQWYQDYYSEKK